MLWQCRFCSSGTYRSIAQGRDGVCIVYWTAIVPATNRNGTKSHVRRFSAIRALASLSGFLLVGDHTIYRSAIVIANGSQIDGLVTLAIGRSDHLACL
jgi:hypothetical protein